jgi:4-hydroxybenzoate polyprenyltransferase
MSAEQTSAERGARSAEFPKPTAFARFRLFLELIRFSHTIFALPFALLSAAMAWSLPKEVVMYLCGTETSREVHYFVNRFRWPEILGILLCMVFARSAAMAFNRVVDAKFDVDNPRTARRHIPAGLVSRGTVALWTALCAVGFVASTLLFLPNRWPLYLSLPFLVFICSYSLTKRFTSLAHLWLGASLMLAPVAAWIAILGDDAFIMPWPPLVLGGAVLLWVAGFDIIYATQDVDVDRKLKLRSVPARFGVAGALRIAATCHLGTVLLLFALPTVFPAFGVIWYVGVMAVAALLVYEHAIVRPDDLTRINDAFFNVNAIISLGLLVVGVVDLLV